MPTKPKLFCVTPGCPNRVTTSGRCQACGRRNTARRRRTSPWWNYGTDWNRRRKAHLAKHPRCQCTGCRAPRCCHGQAKATEVHHPIALQDGGTHNQPLMSACRACHQIRTQDETRARRATRGGV